MDLSSFNNTSLYEAATDLFKQLNIQLNSNTTGSLPAREILKEHYRENETFDAIRNTYFIGIVDDSIFGEVGLFDERYSYKQALVQAERNYDGLMLFALDLDKHPTRTEISDLTRSFNRISQKMPVGLLVKYENDDEAVISIALSERFKYKQNWRQGEKAGKVIILRDIHTITTHTGHIRILNDLTKPVAVTNYAQLHAHWLEVLDVSILNKRFFQELANWYFWAMEIVSFPDDVEKEKELRNATNLIRLITRIIFIWFIKEKKLVPNTLFRKEFLKKIVVDFMKNNKSENYYHAILQNLFFGTLNQVIEERGFAKDGTFQENRTEYGVKNLFRYTDKFSISEPDIIGLFKEIPFLNGGLFDCLDKPDDDGKIIYVDGFSRNPKKQSHIPDYVFFTSENEVDLNETYGTKNKRYKVQGLINLLESYKFTVAENTPIEEEIALDPELLGKVFENLLASYNPETKTTARKQTGSFYTPREIVNYMVDESLIQYLKASCNNVSQEFDNNLRNIFSYKLDDNPFNEIDTSDIIKSINNCKILDPACGSGAFPMGILHKMVHLLNVLDSDNTFWKELQMQKAIDDTKLAYEIKDHEERKRRIDEIEDIFENNTSDYGRKLYLIENCIYGIDIQPIAVQIAKLRFFISLIIDQNKQEHKGNFGIRSLPNLETKFVAANSLIPLEKPQLKTGDIFLNETFQEINALSSQLKEIRHQYFNAKLRTEKLKFQKKDKEFRRKISTLLVKIGHTTTNAHKISSFDPYDQNHYANWFDAEWMFGEDMNCGFDIVIGNPPYLNFRDIKSKSIKEYFFSKYTAIEYQSDLYVLFIEKGFQLLHDQKGILSYIIPNSITNNLCNSKVRKLILDNFSIISIVDAPIGVFESATVDAIILCLSRSKSDNDINCFKISDDRFILLQQKKQDDFKSNLNYNFDFLIPKEICQLIEKIERDSETLDTICDSSSGIKEYETGKGNPCQTESDRIKKVFNSNKKLNDLYWRHITGSEVDNYMLTWSNTYLKYGEWLAAPRDVKYFMNERLIIREIPDKNRLKVSYTDEAFTVKNTAHVFIPIAEGYSAKYLCALLNSTLIGFYFKNKFSEKDNVFPKAKIGQCRLLPMRKATNQNQFISLVDKIIAAKTENINSDVSQFVNEIDMLTFKLYGLNPDEIKLIESETIYK